MSVFVKPRRPAILSPEQRESLSGGEDPTTIAEIAQLAARALFADSPVYSKYQPAVRELLESGGIDQIGELWSNSPADSLPGVLWRLFLIQQWYQRDPETVRQRYAQGQQAQGVALAQSTQETSFTSQSDPIQSSTDTHGTQFESLSKELLSGQEGLGFEPAATSDPGKALAQMNLLLTALWTGHLPIPFPKLLVLVHDYLLVLADGTDSEWITDATDQLADPVTRRSDALRQTAQELAQAAVLAHHHRLS